MALAEVSRLGYVGPDARRHRLAGLSGGISATGPLVGQRSQTLAMLQLLDKLALMRELLLELLDHRLEP